MKRKVVSAMLAAMMMLSTGTNVLAADLSEVDDPTGGSIDVTTTLEEPIYKVVVPTSLEFVIDPYELLENDASVTSEDIQIINRSNVDVQVDMELKVKAEDGITIVDDATKVTKTDKSKIAYIGVEIPKLVNETNDTVNQKVDYNNKAYSIGTAGGDYEGLIFASGSVPASGVTAAADGDMVMVKSVEGNYTDSADKEFGSKEGLLLSFALGKADYLEIATWDSTNSKEVPTGEYVYQKRGANGSTVFRFAGEVNPLALWEDNDLTATATYSFVGMTPDLYQNKTLLTDTHAAIAATALDYPAFTASSTKGVMTYTKGVGSNALDSIVSITMDLNGVAGDGYNALDGYWDAATDDGSKITLATDFVSFFAENSTTKATITYTTVGGETKTVTVDVKTK